MPCLCRHTYNLSMRLIYINSMMQRTNRAVGEAAELTRTPDEPRLVADAPDAEARAAARLANALEFVDRAIGGVPVAVDPKAPQTDILGGLDLDGRRPSGTVLHGKVHLVRNPLTCPGRR